MQSSDSDDSAAQVITLIVHFEGEGTPGSHLYLYVFDSLGKLLEGQPILYGKVTVVLTRADLVDGRIFIGLPGDKQDRFNVSQESMPDLHGHEVTLTREGEENRYELSVIPETVWRWWTIDHLWSDAQEHKKIERKTVKFRLSAELPWA